MDKQQGVPKTDEERKAMHKKLHGDEKLPLRGTGLKQEIFFTSGMGQNIWVMEEGKTYVKNPAEAPKGVALKRGPKGGYYYEEPSGGQKEEPTTPSEEPTTSQKGQGGEPPYVGASDIRVDTIPDLLDGFMSDEKLEQLEFNGVLDDKQLKQEIQTKRDKVMPILQNVDWNKLTDEQAWDFPDFTGEINREATMVEDYPSYLDDLDKWAQTLPKKETEEPSPTQGQGGGEEKPTMYDRIDSWLKTNKVKTEYDKTKLRNWLVDLGHDADDVELKLDHMFGKKPEW